MARPQRCVCVDALYAGARLFWRLFVPEPEGSGIVKKKAYCLHSIEWFLLKPYSGTDASKAALTIVAPSPAAGPPSPGVSRSLEGTKGGHLKIGRHEGLNM